MWRALEKVLLLSRSHQDPWSPSRDSHSHLHPHAHSPNSQGLLLSRDKRARAIEWAALSRGDAYVDSPGLRAQGWGWGGTEGPGSPLRMRLPVCPRVPHRPLLRSAHFLLLVFLKVPLLLGMLGAVLWVHRPLRSSTDRQSVHL